jgi:2-amino-4-hydroxy-6-hydroxymethyldihydropteridine diphosphokinase
MLNAGLDVIRLSRVYETQPVDFIEQPPFLNMVAEIRGSTAPTPDQMLARLLRVEYALGRTRDLNKGPRTIDLDLLIYKDQVRRSEFLMLPHPRLAERRFVLVPLAELVPNLLHPTLKKSIGDLLAHTTDKSAVRLFEPAAGAGIRCS